MDRKIYLSNSNIDFGSRLAKRGRGVIRKVVNEGVEQLSSKDSYVSINPGQVLEVIEDNEYMVRSLALRAQYEIEKNKNLPGINSLKFVDTLIDVAKKMC